MTKKRYLAVSGVLVGIVCLGALVLALLPHSPGVTKAKFDRIQEGMTPAEVETILGISFNGGEDIAQLFQDRRQAGISSFFWRVDEGAMEIDFIDNRVSNKGWVDTFAPLTRFQCWFGFRWEHLWD